MAEFAEAKVSVLKVAVDVDSDGAIAQAGTTVAGTKTISMNGFAAGGNLSNADTVFNKVLSGICGASYDTLTATKTTTQGVTE